MSLNIETFSNVTGGNAFFKAVSHPLAATKARALIDRLDATASQLASRLDLPPWAPPVRVIADPTERARKRWHRWRRGASRRDLRRLEAVAPAVADWGYDLLAGP